MRLARVVGVRLGAERGDLVHPALTRVGVDLVRPDRAELLTLGPDGVGPPFETRLDVRRTGIGGQVEVVVGPPAVDEQVTHGAADQVQAMPGRPETLGDRIELAQDGGEALGDHSTSVLGVAAAAPKHSTFAATSPERTVTAAVND